MLIGLIRPGDFCSSLLTSRVPLCGRQSAMRPGRMSLTPLALKTGQFSRAIFEKYRDFLQYDFKEEALVFLERLTSEGEHGKEAREAGIMALKMLVMIHESRINQYQIVCGNRTYFDSLENQVKTCVQQTVRLYPQYSSLLKQLYHIENHETAVAICQAELQRLEYVTVNRYLPADEVPLSNNVPELHTADPTADLKINKTPVELTLAERKTDTSPESFPVEGTSSENYRENRSEEQPTAFVPNISPAELTLAKQESFSATQPKESLQTESARTAETHAEPETRHSTPKAADKIQTGTAGAVSVSGDEKHRKQTVYTESPARIAELDSRENAQSISELTLAGETETIRDLLYALAEKQTRTGKIISEKSETESEKTETYILKKLSILHPISAAVKLTTVALQHNMAKIMSNAFRLIVHKSMLERFREASGKAIIQNFFEGQYSFQSTMNLYRTAARLSQDRLADGLISAMEGKNQNENSDLEAIYPLKTFAVRQMFITSLLRDPSMPKSMNAAVTPGYAEKQIIYALQAVSKEDVVSLARRFSAVTDKREEHQAYINKSFVTETRSLSSEQSEFSHRLFAVLTEAAQELIRFDGRSAAFEQKLARNLLVPTLDRAENAILTVLLKEKSAGGSAPHYQAEVQRMLAASMVEMLLRAAPATDQWTDHQYQNAVKKLLSASEFIFNDKKEPAAERINGNTHDGITDTLRSIVLTAKLSRDASAGDLLNSNGNPQGAMQLRENRERFNRNPAEVPWVLGLKEYTEMTEYSFADTVYRVVPTAEPDFAGQKKAVRPQNKKESLINPRSVTFALWQKRESVSDQRENYSFPENDIEYVYGVEAAERQRGSYLTRDSQTSVYQELIRRVSLQTIQKTRITRLSGGMRVFRNVNGNSPESTLTPVAQTPLTMNRDATQEISAADPVRSYDFAASLQLAQRDAFGDTGAVGRDVSLTQDDPVLRRTPHIPTSEELTEQFGNLLDYTEDGALSAGIASVHRKTLIKENTENHEKLESELTVIRNTVEKNEFENQKVVTAVSEIGRKTEEQRKQIEGIAGKQYELEKELRKAGDIRRITHQVMREIKEELRLESFRKNYR